MGQEPQNPPIFQIAKENTPTKVCLQNHDKEAMAKKTQQLPSKLPPSDYGILEHPPENNCNNNTPYTKRGRQPNQKEDL